MDHSQSRDAVHSVDEFECVNDDCQIAFRPVCALTIFFFSSKWFPDSERLPRSAIDEGPLYRATPTLQRVQTLLRAFLYSDTEEK